MYPNLADIGVQQKFGILEEIAVLIECFSLNFKHPFLLKLSDILQTLEDRSSSSARSVEWNFLIHFVVLLAVLVLASFNTAFSLRFFI